MGASLSLGPEACGTVPSSLGLTRTQASFLNSRPSHVQLGNTNAPLLPFPTPTDDVDSYVGSTAFQYSCRLAVVVARLQAEVSTLDKYGSPARADSCDQLEHELNTMKEGARPFLDTSPRPIGMGPPPSPRPRSRFAAPS